MIPEAAVEAAAIAFASDADPWGVWGEQSESYRKFYRSRARPLLEAAAPHLVAAALDDAADAILKFMDAGADADAPPEETVKWLRARAAASRPAR